LYSLKDVVGSSGYEVNNWVGYIKKQSVQYCYVAGETEKNKTKPHSR